MFHTQYSGRVRVPHVNEEPSLTHQSFKDEVDVNNILKRHFDARKPLPAVSLEHFADVSELTDYRDALENVRKVEGIFQTLPADTREFFRNDAAQFLDYTFEHGADKVNELVYGPPKPEVQDAISPAVSADPTDGQPPVEDPSSVTGDP